MRKKTKITEQDIIDLGFTKIDQTAEATGFEKDWHYYTLDVGDLCLISNDNEEAEKQGWLVYVFDNVGIVFRNTEDLTKLIHLLKSNESTSNNSNNGVHGI